MILGENRRVDARYAAHAGPTLQTVSGDTQRRRTPGSSRSSDLVKRSLTIEFSLFHGLGFATRLAMSSKKSSGSTATDAVEQHLKNNGGWHEVRDLSNATGYDNGYVRRVAKNLANDNSNIRKRKNANKRVIGYDIHGDLKVPGGNKSALVNLIRSYGSNPPSNLSGKSVSDLQKYLRNNIANGVVPLESKLEFRRK